MKNKLFLLLLFVAAIVVSCNKEKSTPDNQINTTYDLPTKAAVYIDDNYPGASIEYVVALTNSTATYLVTLTTTEELAFDKSGEYLGEGSGFHHGMPTCDTIYGGHHGEHHGGGIPLDSLSVTITDYIAANYPDYNILHARADSICPEGAVTEVVIGIEGTEPVKLIFGAEDIFLMTEGRILYEDTPQLVQDYIAANYPDYTVCNKAELLTLPENILQYIIHMRLDDTKQQVRLAEDGTLVCVSEPDTTGGGNHGGGGHHGGGGGGGHHGGGGGGHHGGGNHGGIPADSLSAFIQDYVAVHYPDYEIQHADYTDICPTGEVIEVVIGMDDQPPVKLIFGTDDTFLLTITGVPYEDVPQTVKDYITANYADYMPVPMAELVTLDDSSLQYLVEVHKMHEMKRVRIAEDGTFVCEQ